MVAASLVLTAASYSEQASVGDWPIRILLTLATVGFVLLILAALAWGWRRRARKQGFPDNSATQATEEASPDDLVMRAKYIGTARADNLFERIVAGGGPAQVLIQVSATDLAVTRNGGPHLPLNAASLVSVATGPGLVQKSYHRHGLVLVTWLWDDREVVSGFWIADKADQQQVLAAIQNIPELSTSAQGGKR